jgi:hypothetical protein
MILHEAGDPMLQDLRLLRPLSPDPARAERVRARCRTRLARTRRSEGPATILGIVRCLLAPLLVGCLCGFYLAGLLGIVLRLRGMLD